MAGPERSALAGHSGLTEPGGRGGVVRPGEASERRVRRALGSAGDFQLYRAGVGNAAAPAHAHMWAGAAVSPGLVPSASAPCQSDANPAHTIG